MLRTKNYYKKCSEHWYKMYCDTFDETKNKLKAENKELQAKVDELKIENIENRKEISALLNESNRHKQALEELEAYALQELNLGNPVDANFLVDMIRQLADDLKGVEDDS